MINELKDVDTNDTVPYEGNDNEMTKVKWSIETNDVDNDFLRNYENMCKSMEDRQINDFYEAQRHIQSAMMGDTPVKTVQNRQCIDNVSDYDSEHHRISKSVHHRLYLGPISLLGAQQHTTVESAAALKRQDKIEGKFKAHMWHQADHPTIWVSLPWVWQPFLGNSMFIHFGRTVSEVHLLFLDVMLSGGTVTSCVMSQHCMCTGHVTICYKRSADAPFRALLAFSSLFGHQVRPCHPCTAGV